LAGDDTEHGRVRQRIMKDASMSHARRTPELLVVLTAALVALVGACAAGTTSVPSDHLIPLGTWGGDDGGLIVGDTSMHLHVGCTFGDVSGRVVVDANGRFDVAGSYMLRAYPITVGPAVPARFTGRIDGTRLTITATVNDTVAHQTVVRGPVSLTLGEEPRLANCPICRRPSTRGARTSDARRAEPAAIRRLASSPRAEAGR
jgi:hypothetical protein